MRKVFEFLMMLYAKSDGTTLLEHTNHVVIAIEKIARSITPQISQGEFQIAKHGAVIHDLGKAHPFFQESLRSDFITLNEKFVTPHRHELSSLLFLPFFPRNEWEMIIDQVVAHHKSLRAIKTGKGRGLLDLVSEYGEDEIFNRHAEDWEVWHPFTFSILQHYQIATRPLNKIEIRTAFDSALIHCERKRTGRNFWRGLLMAADHLASALQEETEFRVESLFRLPNLDVFEIRAAEADANLYPLAKMPIASSKKHTLVIAPTGSGKTDYLLRRCFGKRVFYLLPFQASINAMYLRMERTINGIDKERLPVELKTDIRRIHAAAQIEIDNEIEEESLLQRHPGAAMKVMTPHQIAALAFGISGYEALALDIQGQHVILDEIHVYNEITQSMVLSLVSSLVNLDCQIHIGSATIPTILKHELLKRLGGEEMVAEVQLTNQELETYDRHRVFLLKDEEAARAQVELAIDAGHRVLFISNRVVNAQDRFRWAIETFNDLPILLLHSRFKRKDRAKLEKRIEDYEKNQQACLVISTQVIEVSLDISYDTMMTDCAPLDSLIQRFGRVNRIRKHALDRKIASVYVIAPPDNSTLAKPYNLEILKRSWDSLPEDDILHELSLQELIDDVYPDIEFRAIDVHLIEKDGHNLLQQLCNLPKSELLEALEIDSASVVCESDMETYKRERRETRQGLEIPVSPTMLRSKFKTWRQLKLGNYPFICPDGSYDENIGFTLEGDTKPTCIFL